MEILARNVNHVAVSLWKAVAKLKHQMIKSSVIVLIFVEKNCRIRLGYPLVYLTVQREGFECVASPGVC